MSKVRDVLLSDLLPPEIDIRSSGSEEKMEELINSIREIGVQEPIKVHDCGDGKFEVVFGARRVRAASVVGLAKVPAVISKMTPEQILVARMAENIIREDVSAVDMARYIERVIATLNISQEQAAKMLHLSGGRVSQLLSLLKGDPMILEMVEKQLLPEAVGRELNRHPNKLRRRDLAEIAAKDGSNQQAARKWVDGDLRDMGVWNDPRASESNQPPPAIPQNTGVFLLCQTCRESTLIENMPLFRVCPRCAEIIKAATAGGIFSATEPEPEETTDGPGNGSSGSDDETADVNPSDS